MSRHFLALAIEVDDATVADTRRRLAEFAATLDVDQAVVIGPAPSGSPLVENFRPTGSEQQVSAATR